jgi:hypothetical protein
MDNKINKIKIRGNLTEDKINEIIGMVNDHTDILNKLKLLREMQEIIYKTFKKQDEINRIFSKDIKKLAEWSHRHRRLR